MNIKTNSNFRSLTPALKSSYQHIVSTLFIFLFGTTSLLLFAQPSQINHSYQGISGFNLKSRSPKETLLWMNNHGYPYAQIELDTLEFKDDSANFNWNVFAGKLVTLDTLVSQTPLFNKKTLARCINYQLGQIYNEEKIKSIPNALSQISFLNPNAQVFTKLRNETFGLYLQATRKKNNVLSALVALQPKPNSSQSILTGNIDLELSNVLKQAELIEFHWKRPQPKSQSLAFKLGSPFTGGLPIGFQFEFASFLRDSTFSSTDLTFRLLTKMNDLNGFSAAVNRSTNTHFNNSSDYGNTSSKTYSMRYSKNSFLPNTVNYLLEAQAGNRSIQYESNTSQKKLYAVQAKAWSRINLSKLFYTQLNLEARAIFSDSLYNNEIVRLGGTKNLRAFIEESIYASQYAMLNCDLGVSLGPEIQSFLFGDFAHVNAPAVRNYYDAGVGFRFQQDNGNVSLTYGVGNIDATGLQLKNGRVGITFASRF